MFYRKLTDLTNEEIEFILKDIFETSRVENITRDEKYQRIRCNIFIVEEEPDYADEIELCVPNGSRSYGINAHDFNITSEEEWKWRQFLLAKGCDERLKDNPYM